MLLAPFALGSAPHYTVGIRLSKATCSLAAYNGADAKFGCAGAGVPGSKI
jgi:hypothetical protein